MGLGPVVELWRTAALLYSFCWDTCLRKLYFTVLRTEKVQARCPQLVHRVLPFLHGFFKEFTHIYVVDEIGDLVCVDDVLIQLAARSEGVSIWSVAPGRIESRFDVNFAPF